MKVTGAAIDRVWEIEEKNPTISLRWKNKKADALRKPLMILARPERFELPTPWFVGRHGI